MDNASNPYSAPHARSKKHGSVASLSGLVGFLPWLLLAGGVWIAKMRMMPLYEDFEMNLPSITCLVLWRYTPLLFMMVGIGFFTVAMTTRNWHYRWTLQIISIFIAIGVAAVAAYALFVPLIVIMRSLS